MLKNVETCEILIGYLIKGTIRNKNIWYVNDLPLTNQIVTNIVDENNSKTRLRVEIHAPLIIHILIISNPTFSKRTISQKSPFEL